MHVVRPGTGWSRIVPVTGRTLWKSVDSIGKVSPRSPSSCKTCLLADFSSGCNAMQGTRETRLFTRLQRCSRFTMTYALSYKSAYPVGYHKGSL